MNESIAEMEMVVVITAGVPFTRESYKSIIDLTIKNSGLNAKNWRVSEEENISDHETIMFDICIRRKATEDKNVEKIGWLFKETHMESFAEKRTEMIQHGRNVYTAGELQDHVTQYCNSAFLKKSGGNQKRKAAYWWNLDIADMRKACLCARRKLTRGKIYFLHRSTKREKSL